MFNGTMLQQRSVLAVAGIIVAVTLSRCVWTVQDVFIGFDPLVNVGVSVLCIYLFYAWHNMYGGGSLVEKFLSAPAGTPVRCFSCGNETSKKCFSCGNFVKTRCFSCDNPNANSVYRDVDILNKTGSVGRK